MIRFLMTAAFAVAMIADGVVAQTISFVDQTGFRNFSVFYDDGSGNRFEATSVDGLTVIDFSNHEVGQRMFISVEFRVPDSEGSEAFFVVEARDMIVDMDIRITPTLLSRPFTVPVYYFDEVGQAGFGQIDPISYDSIDLVFAQYFKAAQMAEHYYLRAGTFDTSYFRRSFNLWRDASYYLGSREFDWWLMSDEIIWWSELAFGADSMSHLATLKYRDEVISRFDE